MLIITEGRAQANYCGSTVCTVLGGRWFW